MTARPSEIKALAELLDNGGHESSEQAAKAAILELDRLREDLVRHALVTWLPASNMVFVEGPYRSEGEARRAGEGGRSGVSQWSNMDPGARTVLGTLYHPRFNHNAVEGS